MSKMSVFVFSNCLPSGFSYSLVHLKKKQTFLLSQSLLKSFPICSSEVSRTEPAQVCFDTFKTPISSALLVWSCQCYKLRFWEQTHIWFIFFGHDTSHPEFCSLTFYVCLLTIPFLICFGFVAHTVCISSLSRKSVALAVLASHDLLSFLQADYCVSNQVLTHRCQTVQLSLLKLQLAYT